MQGKNDSRGGSISNINNSQANHATYLMKDYPKNVGSTGRDKRNAYHTFAQTPEPNNQQSFNNSRTHSQERSTHKQGYSKQVYAQNSSRAVGTSRVYSPGSTNSFLKSVNSTAIIPNPAILDVRNNIG